MSIDIISRTQSVSRDGPPFADIIREFHRAVRLEQRGDAVLLSFTVHFSRVRAYGRSGMRPGSVSLFRDKGIRPLALVLRVNEEGSLPAALTSYANGRAGVEVAGYVTEIEMTLFPAP